MLKSLTKLGLSFEAGGPTYLETGIFRPSRGWKELDLTFCLSNFACLDRVVVEIHYLRLCQGLFYSAAEFK